MINFAEIILNQNSQIIFLKLPNAKQVIFQLRNIKYLSDYMSSAYNLYSDISFAHDSHLWVIAKFHRVPEGLIKLKEPLLISTHMIATARVQEPHLFSLGIICLDIGHE